MSSLSLSGIPFGFHTGNHIYLTGFKDTIPEGERYAERKNVITVCTYLPIIGVITGIFMLINLHKKTKELKLASPGRFYNFKMESKVMPGFTFRAVVATMSLGILMLIPDLIVTLGRRIKVAGS